MIERRQQKHMIQVMVVDDDEDMRLFLNSVFLMLEDFHVVAEASSGEEAIYLAKAKLPDLIILDVLMPRMDGIAALPILRMASPGSKIVMVTGLLSSQLVSDDTSMGLFDNNVKPDGIIPKTNLLGSINKLRAIVNEEDLKK